MWDVIEYLKGPDLVIQVQEYFGIRYCQKNSQIYHNDSNNDQLKPRSTNLKSSIEDQKLHKRKLGNVKNESNNLAEQNINSGTDKIKELYKVTNIFWYYLFLFGTELGDEIFYATFIPFWFWNIDGYVGRRVVFVWSSVMYVGQSLKDVIRWARPGPPVIRLQKKWSLEYGMPSTHAMVGFSIPFSVIIYTMNRYQYSLLTGLIISIIWCSVICVSRIYLGMHSVLDIIAGLLLTVFLMIPLIPAVDYLDTLILNSRISPLFILTISIMLIKCYPDSGKWTPTRGDTTMTVSVCAGIQIGAWLNYNLGYMVQPTLNPPYEIIWPSYQMLGLLILRTILGLCCIVATRAIGKSISYGFICALLGKNKNELINSENDTNNKYKIFVELSYKFFTCAMIGFNTQFLLPNVFKMLGIGRPDFYTEI